MVLMWSEIRQAVGVFVVSNIQASLALFAVFQWHSSK